MRRYSGVIQFDAVASWQQADLQHEDDINTQGTLNAISGTHGKIPANTETPLSNENRNDTLKSPPPPKICKKCRRNIKSRSAQCETCDMWTHFSCDNMTKQEIENYDYGLPYKCKACKSVESTTTSVKSGNSPAQRTNNAAIEDGSSTQQTQQRAIALVQGDAQSSDENLSGINTQHTVCTASQHTSVSTHAAASTTPTYSAAPPLMALQVPYRRPPPRNFASQLPDIPRSALHHPPMQAPYDPAVGLTEKESVLDEREKKLKLRERQANRKEEQLHKLELDLKNQAQQNAALKSLITQMERNMLELKEENRLLKIQVLSHSSSRNENNPRHEQCHGNGSCNRMAQGHMQDLHAPLNALQATQLQMSIQSLNMAVSSLTSSICDVSRAKETSHQPYDHSWNDRQMSDQQWSDRQWSDRQWRNRHWRIRPAEDRYERQSSPNLQKPPPQLPTLARKLKLN